MTKKPPTDLRARGLAFWRGVDAGWVLSLDESVLLVEVCRLLDTCDALQEALNRDGVLATGSAGQLRVSPVVGELRACRLAVARMLAQIGLPDQTGATVASPATLRARRAARARWGSHAS